MTCSEKGWSNLWKVPQEQAAQRSADVIQSPNNERRASVATDKGFPIIETSGGTRRVPNCGGTAPASQNVSIPFSHSLRNPFRRYQMTENKRSKKLPEK